MANGVKVRGVCPDGHITDTTAAPKRVTAYVPCAHDGCPHSVNCKRIPRDKVATPTAATPAETPDPHRVIKVDNYDQPDGEPSGAGIAVEHTGPDASVSASGEGGGSAGGTAAPAAPAGVPDPVDLADQPRHKRLGARLRAGRSAGG